MGGGGGGARGAVGLGRAGGGGVGGGMVLEGWGAVGVDGGRAELGGEAVQARALKTELVLRETTAVPMQDGVDLAEIAGQLQALARKLKPKA